MDNAKFIFYREKEIYFIDYSNLKAEADFLQAIKITNSFREKVKASGKKDLLMLVDVSNSFISEQIFSDLKKSGQLSKDIVKRTAVVGVKGVKKTLLDIYNVFIPLKVKPFEDLEEAKNWLIS
jgi:hypothetical protein